MNADVVLLHVVADGTYYSSLEYSPITGFGGFTNTNFFQIANKDGLKTAAHYFLERLKHHLGGTNIETLVEEGALPESILKAAKHVHADIIIMGSHSRRALEQILLGSATEKVLHHTQIPLFIIPIKSHNS